MDLRKPADTVVALGALMGLAFSVFFFMDSRHAHNSDVYERALMSESTRYAQIAKYYLDLKDVRPLNEAEQKRLDLAQREQDRLHKILLGTDDGG